MHLQLPKAAHSSSRALVALVALSGAKVEIADADVKEPVLKANGADVTGPVAIARAIIGAGKNQSVNGPADQQESISSWLAYAASFSKDNVDADLKKLDDSLRLATFLVGAAPSIADVFVYSAIFATIESFNNVQRFVYANVTRWFDHVQHLPALNAHRNRLSVVTIKRNVASILAEKAAIEKGKPAERQHKPAAEAKPEDKAAKGGKKEDKPAPAAAAPAAAAPAPAAAAPAEAKGKKEKPAAKGQGDQKAAGKGKAAGKAEAASTQSDISRLEIKVGKIIEVKQHTENLYVEKIDLGEAAPRTIVSGLVKFVPLDQMQNRFVLVLANLQPRALQGITSEGMVLAASDDAHTTVQLLDVPAGVAPGERVTFPGETGEAEKPHLNKKVLDRVFPDLKTNADCIATYKGLAFTTSKGPVKVASLKDAHIK